MAVAKKSAKKTQGATAHAKYATQVAKGKVKAAAGKVVGDRKLEAKGEFDKVKAKTKQAGQRIKEVLD